MKRNVLIGLGVVAVLLLAFGVMVASAFIGLKPVSPVTQLPNGVIGVADGYVQAFIVPAGNSAAALIDCGNDPEAKALKAKLAELKLTVKMIFITHGHRDHVGGCKQFPEAELFSLETERPLAEGEVAAKGPLTRMSKNDPAQMHKVTRGLTDGETVELGDLKVQVFALPGHTAGSAAYLANEVLFLGDAVTGQADGQVRNAPWMFTDDQAQCRASVQGLAQKLQRTGTPVRALAFAHSGPLEGLAPLASF
jgi:glyoxylase-like metal-dependent hydrolase (beta-lactamase superfamily II)